MKKLKIHQFRAGAPDKFNIWTDGTYEFVKHDNCNLRDWSVDQIKKTIKNKEYLLPADEGDIKYINEVRDKLDGIDLSYILLPQEKINNKLEIINYEKYVPRDSVMYQNLVEKTDFIYQPYKVYSIPNFKRYVTEAIDNIAIKTLAGSGSRGVLLIDKNRLHLGGKYVEFLTKDMKDSLIKYAEEHKCKIMLQKLIPYDKNLKKVNVDFIMRNGKLLGYKWTNPDPTAVFTNWNWGHIINTPYTEKVMKQLAKYLKDNGIYNAIINFEAFSDMKSTIYMVEFNWRYSNSTFEQQASGIDLIGCYLRNEKFSFPKGVRKFVRYWQCVYYDEIIKEDK
jgi:hypothetical protein